MKTICSFDNVACLIDGLPDTGSHLAVMVFLIIAVSAVFASITYKRL